jgi:CRP-like cAMP-binding protein
MADLRKLKDRAAELSAKGKLEKAADVYREVLEAEPRDVAIRQKLAEVLRRAGQIGEAVHAYALVAERFARDGLLIKAIAICKTILELDPRHEATQTLLADLYGKKAAAEGSRPPPRTILAMRAVTAPVIPPTSDLPPELEREEGVSIRLEPPAPGAPPAPDDPFLTAETPIRPSAPRRAITLDALPAVPAPEESAFFQIRTAADRALEAGVAEDVVIDPDLGDEPFDVDVALEAEPPAPAPPPPEEPLEQLEPIDVEPPTPVPPRAAPQASPPRAPTPAPRRPTPPPALPLPHVPLFSDLGHAAFVALTQGMILHRVAAGEAVLREGEVGTSFFVVASGQFAVWKRDETGGAVVLARLGEGDFFGEMALLSGAPRAATVAAEGPGEVLEIPVPVRQEIAARHPHLADSLKRFYRQRLLANAMAVSPLFKPFGKGERKLIMERFRTRDVGEGEVLIREGDRSDGLYVILDGSVDVTKHKDGRQVLVGRLREGDLFGEVSCLRKSAATATVVARRGGTLLKLPRAEFDELVMSYPQILELVSTLSEERLENLDAILSGHAEFTEDGLILI